MRHAELVVQQHEVDRLVGLGQGHGHHDAFAGRQAIGLDHDGRTHLVHVGVGGRGVGERVVFGRGNAVTLHEGLGEGLGAFQLCGRPGGAENAQPMGAELVHHARGQWRFGPDHGHTDLFLLRPLTQRLHVGDGHVDQALVTRRAAIARCDVDHLHLAGLGQFPGQRVFPAAATNNQYLHSKPYLAFNPACGHSNLPNPGGTAEPALPGRWRPPLAGGGEATRSARSLG